jgi:hypothetical protein
VPFAGAPVEWDPYQVAEVMTMHWPAYVKHDGVLLKRMHNNSKKQSLKWGSSLVQDKGISTLLELQVTVFYVPTS